MGKEIKLGICAIVAIIAIFVTAKTLGIVKVEGSEAVVRQHLIRGVVDGVQLSGTHFYFGWLWDVYKYDIGTQKCTFDDVRVNKDAEAPRIIVDCGEGGGQKAWVAMSINYRVGWEQDENGAPKFSPNKLVLLHKDGIGKTYESVIVKRTVIDVINKIARPNKALDIYSGQGFVDFKDKVDIELKNHPVFKDRGIYVENTIIYKVYLDVEYETEIGKKVLAIQQTLRKVEETKAAEEEARRAFAEAQASVEKRRQEAESKKIEQIKDAEAQKAKEVLKAEAVKQKRILEAEGKRDADIAEAVGIIAKGRAEAERAQLLREAMYSGEAGKRRAEVEIAEKQAEKLHGMLDNVKVISDKTLNVIIEGTLPNISVGSN